MIKKQFVYLEGGERKTITFTIEETGLSFNYSTLRGGSQYCLFEPGTGDERYYANKGGQIDASRIPADLRAVIFNWEGKNALTMRAGDAFHDPFSNIPGYQDGRPSTIPDNFGLTLYTENAGQLTQACNFQWFSFLDKTVTPNVDVGFNGGLCFFPKSIGGANYSYTYSMPFKYPIQKSATPKVAFWTATMHDDDPNSPTYGQDFKVLIQTFNAMSYNPSGDGTVSIGQRAIFTDMRLLDAANVKPKQSDGARNVTPYGRTGTYNFSSDKMTYTQPTGYSFVNRWAHGMTLYHINDYQCEAIQNEFWGNDTLHQMWLNATVKPIQGVITLHKLPVSVASGSKSKPLTIFGKRIVSGSLLNAVPLVDDMLVQVPESPQWMPIEEIYGDFFDFAGESSLSVYLPFIGTIPLDINKVMSGAVQVVYNVDVLTGNIIAQVFGKNGMGNGAEVLLYQGTGNCALHIPYCGNDQGGMKQLGALAGIATAGIATIATGGSAAAPAMALLRGAADTVMAPHQAQVNNIPTESAPLSYPYVCYIMTYPERVLAETQRALEGWAASSDKTVSSYTGFLQGVIHAEIEGATDAELSEIESAFSSGVIV